MADTFYAWNTFRVPDEENSGNRLKDKVIKPGDKISPGDLGLDADFDDWKAYVENGAVRTYEHPEMGNFQGSPVELRKAQLAAEAEGGYFDTQYGRISTDKPPEIDPETGQLPEIRQQPAVPTQPGPGGK